MIESAVAPDWSPFQFEQGRFEVIHGLLNDFEKKISKEGPGVDRSDYLAQCRCESERIIMLQEMDYLTALQSQPVQFVGGCLIIKTVAVGGFGVVSLGVDQNGRSVAVKVSHLSWQLAKNRDELDEEAMILKELNHPNIVEFIDCGYDDNWYLITEWVNGHNLRDAIQKIRAPLVQWLDIFCQVCDALEYGHQQGIIHRDINLRNIMVTGNGKPVAKVLDYGVAKRTSLTQSNSEHVKGTRKFIAPEQYNGKCDERSDIYALGVTLREVVQAQYSHPGRVPRPLQAVINKATARAPSRRYQSADEFRTAIKSVAEKISSGEYSIVNQRNRVPVFAAVCLAATAIALFGALYAKGWVFNKQPGPVAILPVAGDETELQNARSVPGDQAALPANPVILLTTDPPDARLAFYPLGPDGPDPAMGISVGTKRKCDEIPPGDYLVVAIWPDGEWIEVLRRIPTVDRFGFDSPPISPFDAFRSTPLGTKIAKITKVEFRNSGMTKTNRFWVDSEVTDESQKPKVASSFGYACLILEAQGKRLPFASELKAYRGSVNVDPAIDEWTCSLAFESNVKRTLGNGLSTTFQVSSFFVFPADRDRNQYPLRDYEVNHIQPVGFRGYRSLGPFGARSY